MPGFNAATVVEALDWSFEPFVKGASGTVKEPTDDQISAYLKSVKALIGRVKGMLPEGVRIDDPVAMMAAIEDLDTDGVAEVNREMADINAALCSGYPSAEVILQVPPRIRNVFYGWLQQEVMDPEVVTGGGAQPTGKR